MRVACLVMIAALGLLSGGPVAPTHAQVEIPPRSFETALEQAETAQTPILIEVYTSWCPYCQRMQDTVYADSTVQSYLDTHFTYVRLNSDTTGGGPHRYADQSLSTKQLASVLGARSVPTTVFLKPDGTPIARQPGFIKRPTFLTMIRFVGSGAYKDQSYKEYVSR